MLLQVPLGAVAGYDDDAGVDVDVGDDYDRTKSVVQYGDRSKFEHGDGGVTVVAAVAETATYARCADSHYRVADLPLWHCFDDIWHEHFGTKPN